MRGSLSERAATSRAARGSSAASSTQLRVRSSPAASAELPLRPKRSPNASAARASSSFPERMFCRIETSQAKVSGSVFTSRST